MIDRLKQCFEHVALKVFPCTFDSTNYLAVIVIPLQQHLLAILDRSMNCASDGSGPMRPEAEHTASLQGNAARSTDSDRGTLGELWASFRGRRTHTHLLNRLAVRQFYAKTYRWRASHFSKHSRSVTWVTFGAAARSGSCSPTHSIADSVEWISSLA